MSASPLASQWAATAMGCHEAYLSCGWSRALLCSFQVALSFCISLASLHPSYVENAMNIHIGNHWSLHKGRNGEAAAMFDEVEKCFLSR